MSVESFNPATLKQALKLKARHKSGVAVVAGGTDFMVALKLGQPPPAAVMDITGIKELKKIEIRKGSLYVGACATFTDILESGDVKERAPLLAAVAREVGARQIRNRATIGGNVASGSPAGDSQPALWVLDASVVIGGRDGERSVRMRKFYTGYRRSVLADDEIILGFKIARPRGAYVSEFFKVGARRAQAISKISLACMAKIKGRVFEDVRLAAGSVAPVVTGLTETQHYLKGKRIRRNVIEKARRLAMDEVTPIDDVRSTILYRRTVLGNLVARFLGGL